MDTSMKGDSLLMKKPKRSGVAAMQPRQGLENSPGCTVVDRQTSYLGQRWGWVEEKIWTKRMLEALGNGVKGGKWFSLIDKVYKLQTLESAWSKVKANKGAAGVDEMSIEKFEANKERYLLEVHEQLKCGTYRPSAVKRVYIPKGRGKLRPLGIPTVKDRIVQTAIKLVIEPIFENEFSDVSYGFRPGRGCKDALRQVDSLLEQGYTWYLDADLQGYFDSIPHDLLMNKFQQFISDKPLCKLVDQFLKHKILEEGSERIAESGTPQGGVLSPLLANLYLHDLDLKVERSGIQMVRYADDFVILTQCEEDAKSIEAVVHTWAGENGLVIHPEKSHTGNAADPKQGFEFLGYWFGGGKKWVRKKSIKAYRDKIRAKTRRTCGCSIKHIVKELNPVLKGWYNYFKHVTLYSMGSFDGFVRRRLRAIMRKQNKRPGYGRSVRDHQEWPNTFFAKLGLFTMETARAQEIACRSRC